jgi:uncharacterized protein YecE (DUF72 family)
MNPAVTSVPVFRLGCPLWSHAAWRGIFFTAEARREEFLPQYASVFDTTEGNATFYGLPARETVARWAEEAPATFRFCWKFPRAISHDRQLVGAEAETREFLERVAPLGGRNGPFCLQLHASFGPERLRDLEAFLRGLPREWRFAVEVRHLGFFDAGPHERALEALLGELGMERVNFDTRSLFASNAMDELTLDAQRRKPRVPHRASALGRTPLVRFVGDPQLEKNDAALRAWAAVVARWLEAGRDVYFFVHHADERHAPALARRFQEMVQAMTPRVPAPPKWPVEKEPRAEQLSLL